MSSSSSSSASSNKTDYQTQSLEGANGNIVSSGPVNVTSEGAIAGNVDVAEKSLSTTSDLLKQVLKFGSTAEQGAASLATASINANSSTEQSAEQSVLDAKQNTNTDLTKQIVIGVGVVAVAITLIFLNKK